MSRSPDTYSDTLLQLLKCNNVNDDDQAAIVYMVRLYLVNHLTKHA